MLHCNKANIRLYDDATRATRNCFVQFQRGNPRRHVMIITIISSTSITIVSTMIDTIVCTNIITIVTTIIIITSIMFCNVIITILEGGGRCGASAAARPPCDTIL